MTSVNAYVAKRAVFDRLAALSATVGHTLADVQVAYAWPGSTIKSECIYGERITFDQQPADAEGWIVREGSTVTMVIRVSIAPTPADGVGASDERVEVLANAIGKDLAQNPKLAGDLSVIGIESGEADFSQNDDAATSTCLLRVRVEAFLYPRD